MKLAMPLVVCLSALVGTRCSTAKDAPLGEEPGAAQSRETTTTRRATTTFTQPSVETRFVWLPAKDILVPRAQLMAKLDQLQAAGFNRVGIDVQFRGGVLYPNSGSLPQTPEAKGEDLLRLCIDAIHARGMKADAWMEYGMYAHFTTDKDSKSKGTWLDAHPELMSVDARGNGAIGRSFGTYYALDASQPAAGELLAKLYIEVATRYDVDGIQLDRLRYAAIDHLSLAGRRQMERELDIGWLATLSAPASHEYHLASEWKRRKLFENVRDIIRAIREAKPGLTITAYVVPPDEMADKSQSYDLWMKDDLLDGISVSMYGPDITDATVKAWNVLPGARSKLYAAISAEQKPADLATNIELSRQFKMPGQAVWYAGAIDDADVKALMSGPYAKGAKDELKAK